MLLIFDAGKWEAFSVYSKDLTYGMPRWRAKKEKKIASGKRRGHTWDTFGTRSINQAIDSVWDANVISVVNASGPLKNVVCTFNTVCMLTTEKIRAYMHQSYYLVMLSMHVCIVMWIFSRNHPTSILNVLTRLHAWRDPFVL